MPKQQKKQTQVPVSNTSIFESMSDIKKNSICIAILFIITIVLFNQIVFKNMIFSETGDTAAALAWGKAAEHIESIENQKLLWLPYIFSGMPGFGSLAIIPENVSYLQTVVQFIGKLLFLNSEMSWLVLHYFLAGLFMFLLARSWKFTELPSLLAAIVFMLSPYAIGLAVHGHGSKMMALSYIPLLLLLTHYLFDKRNILSLGLLSAAIGTALLTNHVQMVYYGFMLIGLYIIYDFITNIKSNVKISFYKIGLVSIALIIGLAISAYVYLSVYEYAQFSMRGGGEAGVSGGLTYDYATNWSFHPFEMLNLLVPSFFGFASPFYWGWMPFTDTTGYFGIVPIILSIIAMVYKRTKETFFFFLISLILLIISFGKHFSPVYDLLFSYLPFFNKFRAPSMILHLLPLVFGMMAAYGLTFLTELPNKFNPAKFKKGILISAGIIAGTLIIVFIGKQSVFTAISPSMFEKEGEIFQLQQQYGSQAQQALTYLKEERFNLLWKDLVKFSIISLTVLGLIYLYLNKKLSGTLLSLGLMVILIIDLSIIDTKFIEPKPKRAIEQHFTPDQTVLMLKKDKTQFRIFPVGQLFMDNTWMYHTLESIGGYSPAKIKMYQEMIDSCLYSSTDPTFPLNMNMVNMLNTKYIIAQGRLPEDRFQLVNYDQQKQIMTYLNPAYLPRAFFVDDVIVSKNKTETFSTINSIGFDTRKSAILEKQHAVMPVKSDTTSVVIKNYKSNYIEIDAYCDNTSLLVLGEVYYPAGWKAYIDNVETEIYKTNYIIRSIVVPPGNHKIEFKFDPQIHHLGYTISHAGWGIALLFILIGLIRQKIFQNMFKKTKAES